MMRSRLTIPAGLAVLALLVGCEDYEPTSTDMPSFDVTGADQRETAQTDEHVFLFAGQAPAPDGFAADVEAAGGTVLWTYGEIGVAAVTGLTDEAAADLAGPGDVVERDVEVQWIPMLDELEWSTEELPDDLRAEGHDPTTAFFFPFQWDMQIIDADDAWNAGFSGSSDVRVAILDTGLDPDHQDLVGLIDAASSTAFVGSLNGPPTWADDNFHGTHVGGTVVTNGIGTSGVAPHTTLIAVKVLNVFGSGSFAGVIGGIMHAANVGADVINMSLSGTFPKAGLGSLVAAVNRAVNFATRNGVLVISAAGNAASDLDHNGNVTRVPCESGNGICISATGPTDQLASYSNFGTSAINVSAPGGDFVVTGNVFTSTVLSPCSSRSLLIPICQLGGFYLFLQGTSMAAPHVAGAAALLDAQSGGGLNAAQLKTSLQNTADDLGKGGTDPEFGKGRINVCELVGC